jgi:methyl-accepting chemotaxis protein
MNVECSACGSEYRINPSKVNGPNAWFKCKNCSETIHVEINDLPQEPVPTDHLDEELIESAPDTDETFLAEPYTEAEEDTTGIPAPPSKTYRFGLTAKVIVLMLLVSLVPGGIYFALSSKFSHERILSETERTGMMVSGQLAAQVDEWMDKNVRVLNTLAGLPEIQSMKPAKQEVILKSLQKEYPWIYLGFTTDLKGLNIARSDGKPLKNYAGRQYVKDIARGSKLTWQNLIGKTSKKPSLVIAVPIQKQGRTIGVLAAAMTREAISGWVTNFKFGDTGSSFLVDQTGRAVAHKNNAFVLKRQDMSHHPLVQAAAEGRSDGIEFTDSDGKQVIGFARTTGLGWVIAIQQERNEAFAPLQKARISALILLTCTLVIVVLISLFSARAIVSPIKELTDAANRISVGEMDVEIITRSKDEVGDLAEAVTRLQDSVRISISRLQRLRK